MQDANSARVPIVHWPRTALIAIVLGAAAACGALGLGYTAYQRAVCAAESRYYELYQQKAQTLAALIGVMEPSQRSMALRRR